MRCVDRTLSFLLLLALVSALLVSALPVVAGDEDCSGMMFLAPQSSSVFTINEQVIFEIQLDPDCLGPEYQCSIRFGDGTYQAVECGMSDVITISHPYPYPGVYQPQFTVTWPEPDRKRQTVTQSAQTSVDVTISYPRPEFSVAWTGTGYSVTADFGTYVSDPVLVWSDAVPNGPDFYVGRCTGSTDCLAYPVQGTDYQSGIYRYQIPKERWFYPVTYLAVRVTYGSSDSWWQYYHPAKFTDSDGDLIPAIGDGSGDPCDSEPMIPIQYLLSSAESGLCTDGIDNDCDGLSDCDDADDCCKSESCMQYCSGCSDADDSETCCLQTAYSNVHVWDPAGGCCGDDGTQDNWCSAGGRCLAGVFYAPCKEGSCELGSCVISETVPNISAPVIRIQDQAFYWGEPADIMYSVEFAGENLPDASQEQNITFSGRFSSSSFTPLESDVGNHTLMIEACEQGICTRKNFTVAVIADNAQSIPSSSDDTPIETDDAETATEGYPDKDIVSIGYPADGSIISSGRIAVVYSARIGQGRLMYDIDGHTGAAYGNIVLELAEGRHTLRIYGVSGADILCSDTVTFTVKTTQDTQETPVQQIANPSNVPEAPSAPLSVVSLNNPPKTGILYEEQFRVEEPAPEKVSQMLADRTETSEVLEEMIVKTRTSTEVRRKARIIETTEDNQPKNITEVIIQIRPKTKLYNFSLYEEIPKSVAAHVSEIEFDIQPEVLNPDPLIVWHFEVIDKPIDINYRLKEQIEVEQIEKINTVVIADKVSYSRTSAMIPLVIIPFIIVLILIFARFTPSAIMYEEIRKHGVTKPNSDLDVLENFIITAYSRNWSTEKIYHGLVKHGWDPLLVDNEIRKLLNE